MSKEVEGKLIKSALNFKYFESEIQEVEETERKINRRLVTTKRAIAALNSVLWSRNIIINTMKIIYNTTIESVLLLEQRNGQ